MNARNSFAALATVAALVAPAPVLAQEWQGAWNTTYGQIRLVEDGDYVYGDYGNIGTIEGVLVQNRQILRAIFTRKDDGSKGYVEWVQSGDDGNRISGYWNWTSAAFPSWDGSTAGSKWRGDRTDDGIPPITQFGSRRSRVQFLAASPSPYRNWLGKGRSAASSGAVAAPTPTSTASNTAESTRGNRLAARFPKLRDYQASFTPTAFEVSLDRLWAPEGQSGRLYGLIGLYAYCQTADGSRELAPQRGQPNRVFDKSREEATRDVWGFNPVEYTRRFALDQECLADRNARFIVQIQTNLKERDTVRATDDVYGYVATSFVLEEVPDRKSPAKVFGLKPRLVVVGEDIHNKAQSTLAKWDLSFDEPGKDGRVFSGRIGMDGTIRFVR